MLHADMCLYKDIQLDSTGSSTCTFASCASAPLSALVEKYAESNSVWAADFSAVFQKMVANGYTNLQDVTL